MKPDDADEPAWAAGRERPPAWRSGEGKVSFDNPWIGVTEHDAVAPTGRPAYYGVVRFKNVAVGVLPLHEDGTVTLVGQQRFPLRNFSWEIPEGGAPFDEPPLEAARRELREETGLEAAEFREILRMELSNSITDERGVCYLATGFSHGEVEPDETEALDVARVPFRALLDAVVTGQVRDSLTVAAVLRAYHMAREGELPGELARAMLEERAAVEVEGAN
ncbi:NUDIX hydrolase [Caulobacter sp. 17J65-9]|uniref:NUDIX domain-containing protein n=1 Tax=Caulobacter sp. 17J65-9 TaxID=2709382 RepID=UPI0013C7B90B|nr:NUDIX hydrolase [Caulobacter sp. 17J65-9]